MMDANLAGTMQSRDCILVIYDNHLPDNLDHDYFGTMRLPHNFDLSNNWLFNNDFLDIKRMLGIFSCYYHPVDYFKLRYGKVVLYTHRANMIQNYIRVNYPSALCIFTLNDIGLVG